MNDTESTADGVDVSIVIPVYNEEGLLATAVRDLVHQLDSLDASVEIILSENGSKDRTLEIARDLSGKLDNVRFLHSGKPNYGRAMRRGIEDARGSICICDEIDICDVDFYRRAIDMIGSGEAEMVVGSKRHPDARDRRPLLRRFATRVINLILRVALGFKGTDTHGLKAFNLRALAPIVGQCVVEKDLFASELVIRAERGGVKVVEVPLDIAEKRPPSINIFKRVPNVLRNLWRLFLVIRLGRKP